VTDVTGLEGARRLMDLLPRSKADPDDLEARGELQVAAWLAYFYAVDWAIMDVQGLPVGWDLMPRL